MEAAKKDGLEEGELEEGEISEEQPYERDPRTETDTDANCSNEQNRGSEEVLGHWASAKRQKGQYHRSPGVEFSGPVDQHHDDSASHWYQPNLYRNASVGGSSSHSWPYGCFFPSAGVEYAGSGSYSANADWTPLWGGVKNSGPGLLPSPQNSTPGGRSHQQGGAGPPTKGPQAGGAKKKKGKRKRGSSQAGLNNGGNTTSNGRNNGRGKRQKHEETQYSGAVDDRGGPREGNVRSGGQQPLQSPQGRKGRKARRAAQRGVEKDARSQVQSRSQQGSRESARSQGVLRSWPEEGEASRHEGRLHANDSRDRSDPTLKEVQRLGEIQKDHRSASRRRPTLFSDGPLTVVKAAEQTLGSSSGSFPLTPPAVERASIGAPPVKTTDIIHAPMPAPDKNLASLLALKVEAALEVEPPPPVLEDGEASPAAEAAALVPEIRDKIAENQRAVQPEIPGPSTEESCPVAAVQPASCIEPAKSSQPVDHLQRLGQSLETTATEDGKPGALETAVQGHEEMRERQEDGGGAPLKDDQAVDEEMKREQRREARRRKKRNKRAREGKRPPPECKFYVKGRCKLGVVCPYSHSGVPETKSEPCKYFVMRCCARGGECPYSHDLAQFPCKYFHARGHCLDKDTCRFSHAEVTPEVKAQLVQQLEEEKQKRQEDDLVPAAAAPEEEPEIALHAPGEAPAQPYSRPGSPFDLDAFDFTFGQEAGEYHPEIAGVQERGEGSSDSDDDSDCWSEDSEDTGGQGRDVGEEAGCLEEDGGPVGSVELPDWDAEDCAAVLEGFQEEPVEVKSSAEWLADDVLECPVVGLGGSIGTLAGHVLEGVEAGGS